MYTTWNFSIVGSDKELASKTVEMAVKKIDKLDNLLAMWKKNSEVYQLNHHPGRTNMSKELNDCLSVATQIHRISDGAFNPAVAPLVQLWYDSLRETDDGRFSMGRIQGH